MHSNVNTKLQATYVAVVTMFDAAKQAFVDRWNGSGEFTGEEGFSTLEKLFLTFIGILLAVSAGVIVNNWVGGAGNTINNNPLSNYNPNG